MRTFDYHAPASLDEALTLLRSNGGGARPLAGGTDIVIQMKEGATRFPYPKSLINLLRVPELRGVDFDPASGLRIGAAATMSDVVASNAVREHYAALAEGAGIVGSVQTMNMATIGGNLCNAAPSADTAPPLLVFDTEAEIAAPSGRRSVPLADFFAGPGKTVLNEDELLVEVRAPAPSARTGSAYSRHTPRKQMDIAVVGVAAALTKAEDGSITAARIALGAVDPTPIRAWAAEEALTGKQPSDEAFAEAAQVAAGECSPISDVRGSAEFRRHLVRVMTERVLRLAAERSATGG